jgi:hypothetical protein
MYAAGAYGEVRDHEMSEPDRGVIMPGFINSPALAKLVALQMLDEERHTQRRKPRTPLRARLSTRRTSTAPAEPRRVRPQTAVVENAN